MIENLRNELVGNEISFIELDKKMMKQGFYSVFDDDVTENIKQDLNVIYTSTETNECEIIVNFKITIDNENDELIENFYLKVVSIEKF